MECPFKASAATTWNEKEIYTIHKQVLHFLAVLCQTLQLTAVENTTRKGTVRIQPLVVINKCRITCPRRRCRPARRCGSRVSSLFSQGQFMVVYLSAERIRTSIHDKCRKRWGPPRHVVLLAITTPRRHLPNLVTCWSTAEWPTLKRRLLSLKKDKVTWTWLEGRDYECKLATLFPW